MMKKLFDYIKVRPLALVSVIFILILYLFMIFAEFIAKKKKTADGLEKFCEILFTRIICHAIINRMFLLLLQRGHFTAYSGYGQKADTACSPAAS